jgi:hypothetical protein
MSKPHFSAVKSQIKKREAAGGSAAPKARQGRKPKAAVEGHLELLLAERYGGVHVLQAGNSPKVLLQTVGILLEFGEVWTAEVDLRIRLSCAGPALPAQPTACRLTSRSRKPRRRVSPPGVLGRPHRSRPRPARGPAAAPGRGRG